MSVPRAHEEVGRKWNLGVKRVAAGEDRATGHGDVLHLPHPRPTGRLQRRGSPGEAGRKAVKWNSPLYGTEGRVWFLGIHTFTSDVKVTFFRGTSLRPVPPGESTSKQTRYLDIHEDDELDEDQTASWIRQAAALPGWGS